MNNSELLTRIQTLEIALMLLINSLRDIKEIPDKTLDNLEQLILKNKKI